MGTNESLVSADILSEFLNIDAEAGNLTWKQRLPKHFSPTPKRTPEAICSNWNSKFAGKPAFYTIDMHGYKHGFLLNKQFSAARVVFAMTHGHWPKNHIDHINGNKTDNRPENLRDVVRSENMRNRAISANNSTGSHGVYSRAGKFESYITAEGKKKHLGRFETIEAAILSRKTAEQEHGYHLNHGRKSA